MTIVSVYFNEASLVAVADGVISNKAPALVLEEDQKIILFEPRYQVPHVSLGRFNYFSDYSTGNFGIAYAGTFSIISSTLNAFQHVIRNCMFLERDYNNRGKPQIYRQENFKDRFRGRSFNDSYNFEANELPPITISLLANILIDIGRKKCSDFGKSAMKSADMQFIVFGEELVGSFRKVRCEVIKFKIDRNNNIHCDRRIASPNEVCMIGEGESIDALMKSIHSDEKFSTEPRELVGPISENLSVVHGLLESSEIIDYELRRNKEKNLQRWHDLREQVVKLHTLNLIERGTSTIGGDATVADIGFAQPLRLIKIKKTQLAEEIENLEKRIQA